MRTEELILKERERCATICRRRAELWRKTGAAPGFVASLREEARARANEAEYLADLLASGEDLPELAASADDADA